ncbi:serine/threonine-protein kinase [Tahibacter sp.]|uniref:serine/threonine-protein kinase n=1 Tax=Tahibacter sp. TaxID=2056211 RepID=UPI0028C4BBC3|nr:serine/threonine-protein kinase [Tahibacter sp.]
MATGSRFAQLRRLFEEVCDLAPEARLAHLRQSGESTDVVAEVEALILAETRGLHRVVTPVAAILAQLPETELGLDDRVGAYRLVEKLASGGMGTVYRAERADGHFEQQAAIKLLRGIPTEDALSLLAAERQILAGLQHPHIARLLDGGATPGGQPYLVMEYVEGIAIDRWCAEHGLRLKARLRLFRNVCRAVAFAHQRLIVHCDLKPSNVLVRADGAPVLLDFGIARALDRTSTRPGDAYYTPGYASPEQMAGAPVSVVSDVYSLGLILFELVSGRKARLDANDRTVTLLSRGQRRASELAGEQCTWRRELHGDIDAIIQRATSQHPGLRYASADALATDIERHLDKKPVHARAPTLRYRLGRLARRRWPLFTAGAAIVIMAAGFSWSLINERDRALAAEREARGQRDRALVAERQALSQAETAKQVSAFLISIFEFANPEKNTKQRDVRARDMLEEGTRKLAASLNDRPDVKGRLLGVLARAWDQAGEPKRSMELYRDSIAQWQRAGASFDAERARMLADLAVMETNNGRKFDAEKTAQEALALREAATPPDESELADSWNTLGLVVRGIGGRDAEAESYLKRALEVRQQTGGNTLAVMHNLAGVYANQGKLDEAIAMHEQVLAAKRTLYGTDEHPSVLHSLDGYARALAGKKRYDEAIAMQQQALALRLRIAGSEGDGVAVSYTDLGWVLQDAGRYAEAIQALRESLRLRRTDPNTVPSNLVLALNNLGVALEETGDLAAAEPLLRESLRVRRQIFPDDDVAVLRGEHNLARLLLRRGFVEEARPLVEHSLAGRRARLSATHIDLGRSLLLRVELLRREGKLGDAEAALAELDAAQVQADNSLRGQRERERARLAVARGRSDAALAAFRAEYALFVEHYGERHPLTAAAALDLAEALRTGGDAAAAKALVDANAAPIEQTFTAGSTERRRLKALRVRS